MQLYIVHKNIVLKIRGLGNSNLYLQLYLRKNIVNFFYPEYLIKRFFHASIVLILFFLLIFQLYAINYKNVTSSKIIFFVYVNHPTLLYTVLCRTSLTRGKRQISVGSSGWWTGRRNGRVHQ